MPNAPEPISIFDAPVIFRQQVEYPIAETDAERKKRIAAKLPQRTYGFVVVQVSRDA